MFDTRNLRAAALGFGLAFVLAPPGADGALEIEDCAHGLASYRYDLADSERPPVVTYVVAMATVRPYATRLQTTRTYIGGWVS